MLADTEPEMAVLRTVDSEGERILEDVFVSVCRGREHHDALALHDLLDIDHGIHCRCPLHVVHR